MVLGMAKLSHHLAKLPEELSEALEAEFTGLARHVALGEWNDAEVDAGRFSEAVLRVIEWQIAGIYTPIDGQQKPNRKKVTASAANNITLAPSLRFQIPDLTELLMDFRNNRNAAHLGKIDPGPIDGSTVHQMASWVLAELIRLYGSATESETQAVINELALRPVPLVYEVAGTKIVLGNSILTSDKVLVLLSSEGGIADTTALARWCEYKNMTRFRSQVLKQLASKKMIFLDGETVHLLPAGSARSNEVSAKNI
jgi:hypothetical protein